MLLAAYARIRVCDVPGEVITLPTTRCHRGNRITGRTQATIARARAGITDPVAMRPGAEKVHPKGLSPMTLAAPLSR